MRLNFLLLRRLCTWLRFTHCNLQENRQNHTEYHNFFNNKHLTLCALCALCGFEKSGLNLKSISPPPTSSPFSVHCSLFDIRYCLFDIDYLPSPLWLACGPVARALRGTGFQPVNLTHKHTLEHPHKKNNQFTS